MQQAEQPEINRRQALRAGCAISSLIGAIGGIPYAHSSDKPIQEGEPEKGIAEIRMKSSRLDQLRQFYEEKLDLPVILKSNSLSVEAGSTRLIFTSNESTNDESFYHFAFNIPENKIESSREWQKKRSALLRRGKNEVVHFSSINAHSVYFNDPAGNIVEYIARHDLNNSAPGEFTSKDILYASEIGLVVDDAPQTAREVQDSLGLKFQRGYRSQSFAGVGDDHALLILVKRNRLWFPNQKQTAKVHPVQASIRGAKPGQLFNDALDYNISVT